MIPVTRPFLPPQEEYELYLRRIWESGWLTNNGPLGIELEQALETYFDFKHILFVSNGTIALQLALRSLGIEGEIITTPFTFVATTTSILWEGCQPVFADVQADTWNIDVAKAEARINEKTKAIVATHVFGNPCDVLALDALSEKYGIPVIYDAAHAFGVRYRQRSLVHYGHMSSLSFHATKTFHTIEGGAVTARDPELLMRLSSLRNFGHAGADSFSGIGINGKNSEYHAAMGLCVLPHMPAILARRKQQYLYYKEQLTGLPLQFQHILPETDYNYAYFPVLFADEQSMLGVKSALEAQAIMPRRYFYPALSHLPYLPSVSMPIAEDIASRIMCLPLYHHLKTEEQEKIVSVIQKALV